MRNSSGNKGSIQLYGLLVLLVLICIYGSIFIGKRYTSLLYKQETQAILFGSGLILISFASLFYAWSDRKRVWKLSAVLALLGVFIFFVFRWGAPERSHLMEYAALALFFHGYIKDKYPRLSAIKSLLLTLLFCAVAGLVDELLQLLVPYRHFDWEDVVFNAMASCIGLASYIILRLLRRILGTSKA